MFACVIGSFIMFRMHAQEKDAANHRIAYPNSQRARTRLQQKLAKQAAWQRLSPPGSQFDQLSPPERARIMQQAAQERRDAMSPEQRETHDRIREDRRERRRARQFQGMVAMLDADPMAPFVMQAQRARRNLNRAEAEAVYNALTPEEQQVVDNHRAARRQLRANARHSPPHLQAAQANRATQQARAEQRRVVADERRQQRQNIQAARAAGLADGHNSFR